MWLLCTMLTFFSWGVADLFYKIGNKSEGEYNHLKTGIFVGLIIYSYLKWSYQISISLIDNFNKF